MRQRIPASFAPLLAILLTLNLLAAAGGASASVADVTARGVSSSSSRISIEKRSASQEQPIELSSRNSIPAEWKVRRAHHPQVRSYDTHHYYAIELHSREQLAKRSGFTSTEAEISSRDVEVNPRDVAELLGAELVERVGELHDHWLIKLPKRLHDAEELGDSIARRDGQVERRWVDYSSEEDPVLRRWGELRASAVGVSSALERRATDIAFLALKSVERQEPRRRAKRNVIYSPWDTPEHYPSEHQDEKQLPWRPHIPAPQGADPDPRNDPDFLAFFNGTALNQKRAPPTIPDAPTMQMASQFNIHDPIFGEQWHLANDRRIGFDLNVTDVWKQGILGNGVNVALIDDGLDMYTDDLKDNYVSRGCG